MLQRFTQATAAAAGAAAIATGVLAFATGTADAAPIGTIAFVPDHGKDDTPIDMSLSGVCPEEATNLIVTVRGSGFPDDYIVVGNTAVTAFGVQDGRLRVPLRLHMRGYADEVGFPTLQGDYRFTVTCRLAFGSTTFGDFDGAIRFTSGTDWVTAPGGGQTTPPATSPPPTSPPSTSPPPTSPPPSSPPPTSESPTPDPTDTSADGGDTVGISTTVNGGNGGSGGSSGGGTGGGTGGGSMPGTGDDSAKLAFLAALLVFLGSLAVWAVRERRPLPPVIWPDGDRP
ncbi:hypothetical protein AB0M28_37525 [Streptomyces sp. NPDC051940]|uniref:hypothetical protein n=1 Tax=Streptomyces sp. NPDC051940 TaxID=3155675 RepID=UPI00343D0593